MRNFTYLTSFFITVYCSGCRQTIALEWRFGRRQLIWFRWC